VPRVSFLASLFPATPGFPVFFFSVHLVGSARLRLFFSLFLVCPFFPMQEPSPCPVLLFRFLCSRPTCLQISLSGVSKSPSWRLFFSTPLNYLPETVRTLSISTESFLAAWYHSLWVHLQKCLIFFYLPPTPSPTFVLFGATPRERFEHWRVRLASVFS